MLVFYFSSLTVRAVGRAAKQVIEAVRVQFAPFRKNGVLELPEKFEPDYGAVVDIVTRGALKQMVWPGIVVVAMPIADRARLQADRQGARRAGARRRGRRRASSWSRRSRAS